ncbi:MAG: ParB/RepB/Spo0J family partition protein [Alphaproteobacteria bacterium]|nr:ParB/RepB/Spo0J family partition protein [Alphaproteobacteria bacterium]
MNATKQKGLGRGLSALMGEEGDTPVSRQTNTNQSKNSNNYNELPISALKPGKYQPRSHFKLEQLQELADSIAHNGIMQPILVRPVDNHGNYEIVAGERRWRAAKLADLTQVPVIIRELSDKLALELAIVENIQRADLSPVEEAAGYQRLMDEFDYTQEELSETVGKSRSHVANLLRLLNLPIEIKDMLDRGDITMGHARALLGNKDAITMAEEIIRKGLNVRQTEALARRDPNKPIGRPRKGSISAPHSAAPGQNQGPKDPDIIALEDTLSENLGLKVSIDDHGSNGLISIQYSTLEQLDDILRRIGGSI